MIAIGIDTGSTSTDAVVYDLKKHNILAWAKSVTTHRNLEIGIREAIRKLPRDVVETASFISLSTTLATNACVEGKGDNICLLFIGASREAVRWTLSSYGFESMDFMRFIDVNAAQGIEPDWQALDEMLPDIVREYDGVAVAQMGARDNDGLFEHQAAERISAFADIPVTCSYDIFRELNVIKRGAGALLNARIAPEIKSFFDAVHTVLESEGLDLPIFVMRSDGSIVSESYTLRYPVETLVCGPTASVKGAAELFDEKQAVVVDMGGTTCDMAILKGGKPKIDNKGIRLAGWQTFVKGVSIETLGLGGDSHVICKNFGISLGSRRVMPMSILAGYHPGVIEELKRISEDPNGSFVPLHEHFLLVRRPPADATRLTETDRMICRALENGPLSVSQLSAKVGVDKYYLFTERLEQQGMVLRCAFTPTDAILLKGDILDPGRGAYGRIMETKEASLAASLALTCMAVSTGMDRNDILDEIYRQVKEKLFCKLVRLLWRDSHRETEEPPGDLDNMAKEIFAMEMEENRERFYRPGFATDAVILGTGSPIGIFLPDVAKALHAGWRVSEYSSVSNALGAVIGDICAYETVSVRTDYIAPEADAGSGNFIVYGRIREAFEDMDSAIERAREIAGEKAEKQALKCGARSIRSVFHEVKMLGGTTRYGRIDVGADVTACARGEVRI